MPRRPKYDRGQVLSVALDLVDREGLDALTIRSLAASLGVGAMTVYGYVRDKDELVAGLVELAFTEIGPPPARGPWQERLRALATGLRHALTAHPALLPVVVAHRRQGPAVLGNVEAVMAVLAEAGLGPEEGALAFRTVTGYVTGAVVAEIAASSSPEQERRGGAAEPAQQSRAAHGFSAAYPNLAAARAATASITTSITTDSFAYGLDLILDGLSARATRRHHSS